MNNPLIYTDPSGELFGLVKWTFIKEGAKAIIKTAESWGRELFLEGGLDITSRKHRRKAWADMDPTANTYSGRAWSDFDPTKPGTQTNNALKIEAGLLIVDYDKPGWGWQYLSRFTWELPNTIIGNLNAHGHNISFNIKEVDYVRGATVLSTDDDLPGYRGVSFGNYIVGEDILNESHLLRHEYGHYLQGRSSGPLYTFKYAIPSALWQDERVETDASNRGQAYFTNDYNWKDYYNAKWYEYAFFTIGLSLILYP